MQNPTFFKDGTPVFGTERLGIWKSLFEDEPRKAFSCKCSSPTCHQKIAFYGASENSEIITLERHFIWSKGQSLYLVPKDMAEKLKMPFHQRANQMLEEVQKQHARDVQRLGVAGAKRAGAQRAAAQQKALRPIEVPISRLPVRVLCPLCRTVSILSTIRLRKPEENQ